MTVQRTADVCDSGHYPDAGEGERPCSPGNIGTPTAPGTFFRRTCHNPDTAFNMVDPTSLHALRCYSPSLAIGVCSNGLMLTHADAHEHCLSLTNFDATDWRLPMSIEEAGLMCGR
eukprot:4802114-Pyramimonas_sp.AAC.2